MQTSNILFSHATIYNGEMYFFENLTGIPGKINLQTYQVEYINNLNGYRMKNIEPVEHMICVDGIIYTLERSGNYLIIIDIEKRNCSYIWIGCNDRETDNFAYLTYNDGCIYIFPRYRSQILRFESATQNINILEYDINENIICGVRNKNDIYLLTSDGNCIIQFNIVKDNIQNLYINTKIYNISSCTSDGKNYVCRG